MNLAVGATATATLVPVLLPLGTPAPGPLSFARTEQINLLSSSPSVISITPNTVLVGSATAPTFTIKGLAPGTSTISLSDLFQNFDVTNAQAALSMTVQ